MTRGLLMINRRKSHINVKSKIVSRIGFSLFIILMILAGTLCGCIDNQGLVKDAIPTQTDSTNGELIHIASGKSNEARLQSEEPKASEENSSTNEGEEDLVPCESETATSTSPAPTLEESELTLYGEVLVHFIDVGQGDSILIQTPEQNILIDAGERTAGESVVEYLRNLNVTYLNIVISTHPHSDHIGGLINVINNITTGEVIDPAVPHTTQTYEDYLVLIDQKNIKFTEGKAGMSRDLGGGALMQIIHPSSPSVSDLNNASIVVRLTFGDISFVFSGDAENEAENEILLRDYDLSATVLKVGHHGSRTSTSDSYLSAVSPKVAVISCGKDNTYGHPHEETLKLLKDSGIDVYRTDTNGTIVIKTDGQSLDIDTQYVPVDNETDDQEEIVPDVKYVGSIKSDKYHYPTCTYAKRILEENQIWFESIEETEAAGYKPCGVCKPK